MLIKVNVSENPDESGYARLLSAQVGISPVILARPGLSRQFQNIPQQNVNRSQRTVIVQSFIDVETSRRLIWSDL